MSADPPSDASASSSRRLFLAESSALPLVLLTSLIAPPGARAAADGSSSLGEEFRSQLGPVEPGWVRLVLCRHGQTDYNKERLIQGRRINAPINDEGVRQATALAGVLEGMDVRAVVSSSMMRAGQTADIVHSRHRDVPRLRFKDLDEVDFGELEGRGIASGLPSLTSTYASWRLGEGEARLGSIGESGIDIATRVRAAIDDLIVVAKQPPMLASRLGIDVSAAFASQADQQPPVVVAVAHGEFLRRLLADAAGDDVGLRLSAETAVINNCGINVVDVNPATLQTKIQLINWNSHIKRLEDIAKQ
ncbi:unnamed protein product [Vitrella brassicaformis CCMP3155]|uniref:Phosphoglycerate mutase n=2 Tax=Vitrella brassicaformis TaxID=1169539 RepID=A0A0G4EKL9_VITBC|nr:unnamed protein product [Vitrella brassicaformis CCMP3155]|eukprot:CEL96969.1 unnamed protein product [Vitrella brassicaformis CCMP3155]